MRPCVRTILPNRRHATSLRLDGATSSQSVLEGSGWVADSPAQNEPDARCTTTRQNPHGTSVVVRYPWHPWFERTVEVERTITKQAQSVLHVVCDDNLSSRLREIPSWMVDPVCCASMVPADLPVVSVDALKALRFLLASLPANDAYGLVETQHSCSRSSRLQGGADAYEATFSAACSAESVSASVAQATLGDAAGGCPAQRIASARSIDQRSADSDCDVSRSEGDRS